MRKGESRCTAREGKGELETKLVLFTFVNFYRRSDLGWLSTRGTSVGCWRLRLRLRTITERLRKSGCDESGRDFGSVGILLEIRVTGSLTRRLGDW